MLELTPTEEGDGMVDAKKQEPQVFQLTPEPDGRDRFDTTSTEAAEASGLIPAQASTSGPGSLRAWRAAASAARRRAERQRGEAQEALASSRASADALAAESAALEERAAVAWRRLEELRQAGATEEGSRTARAERERELEAEASLAEQAAAEQCVRSAEAIAAVRAWEEHLGLLDADLRSVSEAVGRADDRLAEASQAKADAARQKEELEEKLTRCSKEVTALESAMATEESRRFAELSRRRVACEAERRRVAAGFMARAEEVGVDSPEEVLRQVSEDPSVPQKGKLLARYAELSTALRELQEQEKVSETAASVVEEILAEQRAALDAAVIARQEAEESLFDASQKLMARTVDLQRVEAGEDLPPVPPERQLPGQAAKAASPVPALPLTLVSFVRVPVGKAEELRLTLQVPSELLDASPEDAPRIEICRSVVRIIASTGAEASFTLPEGEEPIDEANAIGRFLWHQRQLLVSWPATSDLAAANLSTEAPLSGNLAATSLGASCEDGVVRQGWVVKQSQHTGVWRRRWMVLRSDGHIRCFQDPSRYTETASFRILGGGARILRDDKGPLVLSVIYPSKRRAMLRCFTKSPDTGKATELAFDAGEENSSWKRALLQAFPDPQQRPRAASAERQG